MLSLAVLTIATAMPRLPPDLPLASPPALRGADWLDRGQYTETWGHLEYAAMTDPRVIPDLVGRYGFNIVGIVPREAHNAMCAKETVKQQCTAKDVLSKEQFDRGLTRWAAHNVSVILYTAIMHCGHSPVWESGELEREHPEYASRDEFGVCPTAYGQCDLTPTGGNVEFVLNYTLGVVDAHPIASGIYINNTRWYEPWDAKRKALMPTGFEASARAGFKAYVGARFGASARAYLGVDAADAEPPRAAQRSADPRRWRPGRRAASARAASLRTATAPRDPPPSPRRAARPAAASSST